MNIYELEKKATPGPFTASDASFAGVKQDCVTPDGHRCALFREFGNANVANALLWGHCRNHFMRALEALKELANRPDCEGPLCHYCDTGLPHPKIGGEETLKLIAELEDVK